MKLANIEFLVGIASLLQISSVSGAALRNRNRVEGEICNTVLKNYSDKNHILANCDWAEQLEQQKLGSQPENLEGDQQDISPEPESALVRRVPGANLSLASFNSGITAQKPLTSGINFTEGEDIVLDGVSGTYGRPPSSFGQIPSSSLPDLSPPSHPNSELQLSPISQQPSNQLGSPQIANVQQTLNSVENILALANPAENPLTASHQQSDYEDYPLLGAAAGGWAPSEAAVNVPTLLMETSLNIGSAAAVSTSHSEYLNLEGDHENPAVADVLFGSNSYHTVHGNIEQQSSGSENGTQHNEGWVDGGSSQMYEIAVMGDTNDISVGGSSDALGMATVVQESLSDTLFGSGGTDEEAPAPEMVDANINSEAVLTAAEMIAQPEPEQAIATNDILWEDLLAASNAAYVVPEQEHFPQSENDAQQSEAEEILHHSEYAGDNSQASEVAQPVNNISEQQEIPVGQADDAHLPDVIINDISELEVPTADAESAVIEAQPESVEINAEPELAVLDAQLEAVVIDAEPTPLFFGKPESPPFQGKPEASDIFENSESFLLQISLESSPFEGKPDTSIFEGRPQPFLLYGAPESFQLSEPSSPQHAIYSIPGVSPQLIENAQEAQSNEEKVDVETLIPQQPSSNSIFEDDGSEQLFETEEVPQPSEEMVDDSQAVFAETELIEEAVQAFEEGILLFQEEVNNVPSAQEPESEIEFQVNSGHQEVNEPESEDIPYFFLAASPELQLLEAEDEFQYATDEHIEVPAENFNHNNEDFNQIQPEIITFDKPQSSHENVEEQKPEIVEVYAGNADLDFSSVAEQIVMQLSGENPPIVEIDTGEDEFNNPEEDGLQASVLQ